ncbi:MAG: ATP phosphoribosyltransferase regulatory subunit [Synechococcus sp.]|nr:ATP phosphoribosyltransferase regulatory subunit [Synechococcus sp.]
MALQPASGARDLNPQQVEHNQVLRERLAEVYRCWGYEEVSPPQVERMDTLKAGGGINSADIVRLVADEPLGLRPELTASIARAATTRLAERARPLRLWSTGTVFESRISDEGGQRIEEQLHSGVELFGSGQVNGELELLSLLMASLESLELQSGHDARLLVGHAALMELILAPVDPEYRDQVKDALVSFDRLQLEQLPLTSDQLRRLQQQIDLRGTAEQVLEQERRLFGPQPVLSQLERLFKHLIPIATRVGVELQLDPSFQPHFELYDGLVFQLVCQGSSAPVVIARGGRYDRVLKRFGAVGSGAAGLGFSFCLDDIRDLPSAQPPSKTSGDRILVAYGPKATLESALQRQHQLHRQGLTAMIELEPLPTEKEAQSLLNPRGCSSLAWLAE